MSQKDFLERFASEWLRLMVPTTGTLLHSEALAAGNRPAGRWAAHGGGAGVGCSRANGESPMAGDDRQRRAERAGDARGQPLDILADAEDLGGVGVRAGQTAGSAHLGAGDVASAEMGMGKRVAWRAGRGKMEHTVV